MSLPLISIIVPVYNTAPYVKACLKSLLDQTYMNFEILVIDDATPDNAVEVVKSIDDNRIKVIHHDTNKGLSQARNTGIENAQGSILSFVDSDDLVHPQMLEILYHSMLECNADFVYSGRELHINSYEEYQPPVYTLPLPYQCLDNPFVAHLAGKPEMHMQVGAKLYKKSALGDHRFLSGVYYEDLPFNLVFLDMVKRAAHVPTALYYYINRPGSITKSGFSLRKGQSYCAVSKELHRHFKHDPKKLKQVQGRYINRIVKRGFKGIFNSADKANLLEVLRPEIKQMYADGVIGYRGLSPRSCWQLWQVLRG